MDEVKDFAAEKQRVLKYLISHQATAGETAVALNIYRPNMCRHKRQLEEAGLLIEVGKRKCSITNFKAAVLTTNAFIIEQHKRRLPQLALAI